MATEPGAPSKRPSPLLLALLGLTVAAAAAMKLMGSASPGTATSNPSSPARTAAQAQPDASGRKGGSIDPAALDVHLEVLEAERPAATEAQRNPFRFRPPPAPPAPPPSASKPAPPPMMPTGPIGPPPPPPPPPITVKFIGLIDRADGSRLAVFTDCSAGRRQSQAREGGTVDGRYRLVKIGRESVIIEHLDGRGRTTLAAGGQECVK